MSWQPGSLDSLEVRLVEVRYPGVLVWFDDRHRGPLDPAQEVIEAVYNPLWLFILQEEYRERRHRVV